MSNLEHAIENALVCIENGKSFKEFAEKEKSLGNLNGISATAEEIWEIAVYVKYTYCNACDVKGGLTMAKCENCYHAGVCPHRIKYEDYDCECANYKDKSLIVELPCRVRDTVYIPINELEKFGGSYIKEEKIVEISTAGRIWTDDCYYDSDDFGKTVFLSREEAERALEESEKNG